RIGSPLAQRTTVGPRSSTTPASKVTRVRKLGFSNIIARHLRANSGWGISSFSFRLSPLASAKILTISSRVRSRKFNRSRLLMTQTWLLASEHFISDPQPSLDFLLVDGQWRNKTKNLISRAIDQQARLQTGIDDLRPLYFQLQSQDQPLAANAPHKSEAIFKLAQTSYKDLFHLGAILDHSA